MPRFLVGVKAATLSASRPFGVALTGQPGLRLKERGKRLTTKRCTSIALFKAHYK